MGEIIKAFKTFWGDRLHYCVDCVELKPRRNLIKYKWKLYCDDCVAAKTKRDRLNGSEDEMNTFSETCAACRGIFLWKNLEMHESPNGLVILCNNCSKRKKS